MSLKGLPRKPGGRVRIGRRTIGLPTVPSMADAGGPAPPQEPAGDPVRPRRPIDRAAVQYLDRVRAVFRPRNRDGLAPGLARFIGSEDVFRHVGTAPHGAHPMMQCPPHWSAGATWVPIGDLEILEILEDQDVRAG
jgi:hypothetical protein